MNLILAIVAASASPAAQSATPVEEARIPLVRHGAIRNFRPGGPDIVYLQVQGGRWYKATLTDTCHNLAGAVRMETEPYAGTLDNTGTLIFDGERCRIHSLVRSEAPPRETRRR